MTSKEFLDRVVRGVPFVVNVDLRRDAFNTTFLHLRLWKGGEITYEISSFIDADPGFIDVMIEKFAYEARVWVSKALAEAWGGDSWKGILQHEGFEKIILLANPLPLIRYDIPVSMSSIVLEEYHEDAIVPTLPQRRIEFHLQRTNPQTRVAYYSSQR